MMGRLRRLLAGLSDQEATFARRGFPPGIPGVQKRLELVGRTFILGYNESLQTDAPDRLARTLNTVPPEFRGFAYEGAAMGLTLLDLLTPWRRNRFQRFLAGPGARHVYMAYVGAGWALARLRRPLQGPPAGFDPLLGWLAIDGYGFHQGYFHWQRYIAAQERPRELAGYALRAFDQGLGRCLWFVSGGDIGRAVRYIKAFADDRQADLWSGLGLAAAYAGGVDRHTLELLRHLAGPHRPHAAQGAAFAAQARLRAQTPSEATEAACRVLCGSDAAQAAAVTDQALTEMMACDGLPDYEGWRRRIQASYTEEAAHA